MSCNKKCKKCTECNCNDKARCNDCKAEECHLAKETNEENKENAK